MSQTFWTGPLASGDKPVGSANSNVGLVLLTQSVLINFDTTLVQNGTVYLPLGSRIVNVFVDVLTAYNSATSATLTVGTASADTTYVSGVNAKTAARTTPTFTTAQLTAMGSTTLAPVVTTITSVGQPTAGQVRVNVQYAQTTSQD